MRERLLVRHFLRRLLENDLISPDADRHEVLGLVLATLVTAGLVSTVFIAIKYQFSPLQLPGWSAVTAMDDVAVFAGASMTVLALVAVVEWDALGLDVRDSSILGPLPVPLWMIVRAKLTAVVVFALAFALALNAIPSAIYPVLLTSKLPVSLAGLLGLVLAHLVITAAAGAFGFMSVVAVHGLGRAISGERFFARISNLLQGTLLVGLATTFLLLPRVSSNVSQQWLGSEGRARRMPVMWFVGLHEWMAGAIVDDLPRLGPPADAPNHDAILEYEHGMTREYRSHRAELRQLGIAAAVALGLALLLGIGAAAFNGRTLPSAVVSRPGHRRSSGAALARWVGNGIFRRRRSAQAGYFFALQTLGRSAPHRASLAVAAAAGLAVGTLAVRGATVASSLDAISVTSLATQSMLLIILVAGIHHAARIPADAHGTWVFQMTWSGHEREYLLGVKAAVFLWVLAPAVVILGVVHCVMFGGALAAWHAAVGLAVGVLLLEIAFVRYRKVPLAVAYEPGGNHLGWSPIYLLGVVATTHGLAWIERVALESSQGALTLIAGLAALALSVRLLRDREPAVDWGDLGTEATQRLTLRE